eukprot:COSAG03_NODE_5470_length_1243_cov_1.356643_2_plen_171_part_00
MTRAAAAAATAATPQPMRDGSDADPNCALAGKRCSRLCNMCSATGHGCTPAMGGLRPTMFRIKSSVALTKMQAADGTAMFSADEIASGKVCVHGRKEANDLYEAIADTPAPKNAVGVLGTTVVKRQTRGAAASGPPELARCPLCARLRGKHMRANERPGFCTSTALSEGV